MSQRRHIAFLRITLKLSSGFQAQIHIYTCIHMCTHMYTYENVHTHTHIYIFKKIIHLVLERILTANLHISFQLCTWQENKKLLRSSSLHNPLSLKEVNIEENYLLKIKSFYKYCIQNTLWHKEATRSVKNLSQTFINIYFEPHSNFFLVFHSNLSSVKRPYFYQIW